MSRTLEPGDRIDVWIVEARLGEGGMGAVYRCHNQASERILAAVKVLDVAYPSSQAQQRFVREAEILFQLDHPNIVGVRNVRMDVEPPYLEMDFVEGRTLDSVVSEGALSAVASVDIACQLLDAVAYMHDRGVRHRDIKPANLILTDEGRVKLVDFGLAMEADLGRITGEGLSFGTVSYAPPEWGDPERLDPVQWDLYSVGVVLYEILTGVLAFPLSGEGPTRKQLLQVLLQKQSAAPLDPGPEFSDPLRDLVRGLTATDPDQRPASAWEALDGIAGSSMATRERMPAVRVLRRRAAADRRALGWIVALCFVAALAVLAALATDVWLPRPHPDAVVPELVPDPLDLRESQQPRDLEAVVTGLPASIPGWIQADGQTVAITRGRAVLSDVGLDVSEITWLVGRSCQGCPDAACAVWCGRGSVSVPPEDSLVPVRLSVPQTAITVAAPELFDAVGSPPFRRKRKRPLWPTRILLDGVADPEASHHAARFLGVDPGIHEIGVHVGECPEAALGCWPDGACPEGCRSTLLAVEIAWNESEERIIEVDLPPP